MTTFKYSPDTVETNRHDTALLLWQRHDQYHLRQHCLAVEGRAEAHSAVWEATVARHERRLVTAFLVRLAASVGIALAVLWVLGFDRVNVYGYCAAIAFIAIAAASTSLIREPFFTVEGIGIDSELFNHLTEAQRDALFAAREQGGDAVMAMKEVLLQQHLAQQETERQVELDRKAQQHQDHRAAAAALLKQYEAANSRTTTI